MKFLIGRYRTISIWLSLAILTLTFIIASDSTWQTFGVPAIFLIGFLMYLTGSIREWKLGRRTVCLLEAALAVWALAMAVLAVIFHLGGVS